ncbi:MAG: GAF domain-containing protein [Jatrophihabitantaceae bacterium]
MSEAGMSRETLLGQTFVQLADSLVTGFDVVELLDDLVDSAVALLDLAAAGLMLTDQRGNLRVMAASSEGTRTLELLELQNDEGPCLECFRTGQPVYSENVDDQDTHWPLFAAQAREHGFGPVYALPMRLRTDTIGALNLFRVPGASMSAAELDLGQALADVATIAIVQHRTIRAVEHLAEQLQAALSSRVAIEQAKGALAERAQIEMSAAFELMRTYARRTQQRLSDVAAAIASGQLPPAAVLTLDQPG